jgi:hypothetical protein
MTLEQIKNQLAHMDNVNFQLPNGSFVPEHFHVTEVGVVSKLFIDCGGIIRNEKVVSFQLWEANDFDHKLKPQKLLNIIALSERKLDIDSQLDVEVEYQSDTIGKYDLDFSGKHFILVSKQTNCLASDKCGIPPEKLKILTLETNAESCCTSDGGCC